jgi:hypothetical protein
MRAGHRASCSLRLWFSTLQENSMRFMISKRFPGRIGTENPVLAHLDDCPTVHGTGINPATAIGDLFLAHARRQRAGEPDSPPTQPEFRDVYLWFLEEKTAEPEILTRLEISVAERPEYRDFVAFLICNPPCRETGPTALQALGNFFMTHGGQPGIPVVLAYADEFYQ